MGSSAYDAAFDGVAALGQLLLRPGQPLAAHDAKLRLHEIDAGHHFGDGMLDLETRVHFEEVEAGVIPLSFDQELDGPCIAVAGGPGRGHGRRAHSFPQAGRQCRRGTLFDDLLMTALKRALPFEDVHDLAVLVAEDLDLDVAGFFDEAFHVESAVTKRGSGSRRAAPMSGTGSSPAGPCACLSRHRQPTP